MTILVTGATGMVGARILKRLLADGVNCRAIVRQGKQVPATVTAFEADLLDPISLKAAVEGVTDIVHLAAVLRTQNPDDIWKANLEGTKNLIEAAKQYAPEARIVMASTSLVYSADSPYPGLEDDAVDPKMAYPASKVAAEKELQSSGLNWSILRFAFVYGDDDGHLQQIPKLAELFKWHPANKLSLVHHRDIEAAVRFALDGGMDRRIVNIVDEAPQSIYEIMGIIGTTMESSAEPLSNPWFGQIDGSLARSLGLKATVATIHQAVREGAL